MPAFVVLEHDHPALHWDFMLEHAGVLKTWRLPAAWPEAGTKVLAQALADHRLLYLDYEGPVSGDRGRVMRRDRGCYELITLARSASEGPSASVPIPRLRVGLTSEDPFDDGLACMSLQGSGLCGIFVLERLQGSSWQLWRLGNGETL